jgi:MoxR-like ATPase
MSLIPVLTTADLNAVGYYTRNPADDALLIDLTEGGVMNRNVLIVGDPGVGKTEIAHAIYRAILKKGLEAAIVQMQFTASTNADEMFVGPNLPAMWVPGDAPTREEMLLKGHLWRAAECSHTRPTILLLDEIDKSQPRAEYLTLGFLQDGRVQGSHVLGKEVYADLANLIVVVTSNGVRSLSDAFDRRVFHYHMEYLDPVQEAQLLRALTGAPVGAISAVIAVANAMRKNGVPVSAQQMRYLLTSSRKARSIEHIAAFVKGRIATQPHHLSPNDIAKLSAALWNEFSVGK